MSEHREGPREERVESVRVRRRAVPNVPPILLAAIVASAVMVAVLLRFAVLPLVEGPLDRVGAASSGPPSPGASAGQPTAVAGATPPQTPIAAIASAGPTEAPAGPTEAPPTSLGEPSLQPTGTPTADPSASTSAAREAGVHIVQPGQTLRQIAELYNTTVQELADYNELQNPDLVFAGQRIELPPEN